MFVIFLGLQISSSAVPESPFSSMETFGTVGDSLHGDTHSHRTGRRKSRETDAVTGGTLLA